MVFCSISPNGLRHCGTLGALCSGAQSPRGNATGHVTSVQGVQGGRSGESLDCSTTQLGDPRPADRPGGADGRRWRAVVPSTAARPPASSPWGVGTGGRCWGRGGPLQREGKGLAMALAVRPSLPSASSRPEGRGSGQPVRVKGVSRTHHLQGSHGETLAPRKGGGEQASVWGPQQKGEVHVRDPKERGTERTRLLFACGGETQGGTGEPENSRFREVGSGGAERGAGLGGVLTLLKSPLTPSPLSC